MSRLVRCIEGHIFEADKGATCPVCGAPTSVADDQWVAQQTDGAKGPEPPPNPAATATPFAGAARKAGGPPKPFLYGGIAIVVIALATAGWLLRPASKPPDIAKPEVQNARAHNEPTPANKEQAKAERTQDRKPGEKTADNSAHDQPRGNADARQMPPDRKPAATPDEQHKNQPSAQTGQDKLAVREQSAAKRDERAAEKSAVNMGDCKAGGEPKVIIAACGELIDGGKLANDTLAEAYAVRGGALRDSDQTDAALADFGEAINLKPKSAEALSARGQLYLATSAYDKAIADLDQAIALDPKSAGAYCDRGDARWLKGDLDGAMKDVDASIRLAPEAAHCYVIRASVDEAMGQWSEAINDSTTALEKKPLSDRDAEDAYVDRAYAYSIRHIWDRSIDDFTAALRVNPKSVLALNFRGEAYTATGRSDLAWNDYTDAIRIDPKSAMGYFRRAELLQQGGRCDQALEDYTTAARLDPKSYEILDGRAKCLVVKGQFDAALADANAAAALAPNEFTAFMVRGGVWMRKQDFSQARGDFAKAIQLQPNNAEPYRWHALASSTGEQDQFSRCPRDNHTHGAPDLMAGGEGSLPLCVSGPQYSEAFADLEQAIKRDPDDADAYHDRGRLFHQLKQYDRALDDYTTAIHINQRDASFYNDRGNLYYFKRQYDAAISDFSAAIRVDGNWSQAYANRGSTYLMKGDRPRAISDLRRAVDLDQSNENAKRILRSLGVSP